jgi:glycosyltransferase involved in cell wall biosynthesis
MKILITAPSLDTTKNIGGISSVVANILSTSKLNYIHFIVGKSDSQGRNFIWLFNQLILPFSLAKALLFNKIDILHLNSPLDYLSIVRDFVLLLTAKSLGSKIILHLHGGQFMSYPPSNWLLLTYLRFYFFCANHIIVLSDLEKNFLIKNYKLSSLNITVLENCVVIPQILPQQIKKIPRIIFLGRIVERKGIRNIVEAICKLSQIRSDFEFYLYGSGFETNYAIEELTPLLPDTFKYIGVVADEKKFEAYAQADIFLLPSLFGEGLPMALLESMSYGVIPIVTNDGSMSTVVENGKNGFLVEKNNSEQLFEALNYSLDVILSDRGSQVRLSAIETIKSKYNCYDYANRLEQIYFT